MRDWVKDQIDRVVLDTDRPLIISDADEVLFQFVRGLEAFLETAGLYLDLSSFRLSGNIKNKTTNETYPIDDVPNLLAEFFAERTRHLEVVEGAQNVLNSLRGDAQIVVLTNVPAEQKADRVSALERNGLDFPVIANSGDKGPAAAYLATRVEAPIVFIDDIPPNLDSVKQHANHIHCVHFVSHPRLSELIEAMDFEHPRAKSWMELDKIIRDHLFD